MICLRQLAGAMVSSVIVLGVLFAIHCCVVVPIVEGGVSVRIVSVPQRLTVAAFGDILFEIRLRNFGAEDVVITGCEADCGCTTPIGLSVVLPGHA